MSGAKEQLASFIRWVMRDSLFYGVYAATVSATSSGDTADLTADDPRIKGLGLQGVPISYGLPDCKATIPAGCRVLVVFENGDPTKPRCSVFDGSAIDIQLGGGTLPVARVGDTITITNATSVSGGAVTGTGVIAGGAAKTKAG